MVFAYHPTTERPTVTLNPANPAYDSMIPPDFAYPSPANPALYFDPQLRALRMGGPGFGSSWTVQDRGTESAVFGNSSVASGACSFIGGGGDNRASGFAAGVVGGSVNKATADHSAVVGGRFNQATGDGSAVLGGGISEFITVPGDPVPTYVERGNTAAGDQSVALGGVGNRVSGARSVVMGGEDNDVAGDDAVAGGAFNTAAGRYGVAFGSYNNANGNRSVAIGSYNTVDGEDSVALGARAVAAHNECVILSTGNETTTTRPGQCVIGAASGVVVHNDGVTTELPRRAMAWMHEADATVTATGSPIDAGGRQQLLAQLATVPMYEYADPMGTVAGTGQRRYGPLASEWYGAFPATHPPAGYAGMMSEHSLAVLATIGVQALVERVAALEARLAVLEG